MPSTFHKSYGSCQGPLDFPMQEDNAREMEQLLDTGEYSGFKKSHVGFEAFLPSERADVSVITEQSVDSDGELVLIENVDFTRFQKNPVISFNHHYNIPPIGKSLWQKKINKLWKAKSRYFDRPSDFTPERPWFTENVFHLIKENALPGKSLGGLCKRREPTKEEKEEYPGVKKIIEKSLVYEYAVCPFQCHPNAIVESISKSLIQLPEEILSTDFPDVYEAVKDNLKKQQEQDEIIIKSFTTKDDFLRRRQLLLKLKAEELIANLPNKVDEYLRRKLGKVS